MNKKYFAINYIKRKPKNEITLNIYLLILGCRDGALLSMNRKVFKSISTLIPSYIKYIPDIFKSKNLFFFYNSDVYNANEVKDDRNTGKILSYDPSCDGNLGGSYGISFFVEDIYLFGWRCDNKPNSKYINCMEEKISKALEHINMKLDIVIEKRFTKDDLISLFKDKKYKTISENINLLYHYLTLGGSMLLETSYILHEKKSEGKLVKFLRDNSDLFMWVLILCNEKNIDMVNYLSGFEQKFDEDKRFKTINNYFSDLDLKVKSMIIL